MPFRTLDATDVRPVNACEIREAVLGQTALLSEPAKGNAQCVQRRTRSSWHLAWVGD